MVVRTKFNGYSPDGRRIVFFGGGGGGGSSEVKYAGLENLYQEQADSARLLRGIAEENLPGATQKYVGEVGEVLDSGYADRQAAVTGSDMATANAQEREASVRELSSMGVNPNDPRFAGSLRQTETGNAARMAAGKNMARRDAQNKQLAVAQDAVGTFTGQSNQAASQLSNTTSGMSSLLNQQQSQANAERAQKQQNTANAVGGTMMALSYFNTGGLVRKPKTIERHAGFLGSGQVGSQQGGFGGFQTPTPPPSSPVQQQEPTTMDYAMQGEKARRGGQRMKEAFSADRAATRTDTMGKVAGKFSPETGNQISSRAAGMRMNAEQAKSAADAYEAAAGQTTDAAVRESYLNSAANIKSGAGIGETATAATPAQSAALQSTAQTAAGEMAGNQVATQTGNALMSTAADTTVGQALSTTGTQALASGATTAGTTAATTAGTTAAASGLAGAAGAVATALPWVAAAYGVGSLLGAWADGGEITDNGVQDLGGDGGKVEGTWEGNTDTVPALVTEEEHVINAEAAALAGHDELEALNAQGLALREQGKSPHQIRAAGLRRAA